jgi:uncharacterized protein (DUF2141 family)
MHHQQRKVESRPPTNGREENRMKQGVARARSGLAAASKGKAFLLSIVAVFITAEPSRSGPGGTLTVRFSGLEELGGELLVSVANSREMFESDDLALFNARVPVDGAQEGAVFEGVPPGEYAVKAFHDTNDNQKIDIGRMGPKEKYGFSNNVVGFMGPPDFDDAKFEFDGGELTVEIEAR